MVIRASEQGSAAAQYLAEFSRESDSVTGIVPGWLGDAREQAMSQFAAVGFPTTSEERWRFTNFSKLLEEPFTVPRVTVDSVPEGLARIDDQGWWAEVRLVFVDGRYNREMSSRRDLPPGVFVGSLADAVGQSLPGLSNRIAELSTSASSPFAALNTAFMADGAVISVPAGVVIDEPIQCVFVSSDREESTVTHPRNLLLIGDNAQATIVENYLGLGDLRSWTNAVTEIVVGRNAHLAMNRVQREGRRGFHTAMTRCKQARDSSFSYNAVEFGASLTRHDIRVELGEPGASCELNGLLHLKERQHADNHTTIEHVAPDCTSRESFNGIFDGASHGVFTGQIHVHPGAVRTDSKQSSKNLLLSGSARADAQPQLEIYADDVRCTHGATVGPIDDESLFYLRSKGLSEAAARALLTYGYANDVIDSIRIVELRERLDEILRRRLEV